MSAPWSFVRLGVDIIGLMPLEKGRVKFIVLAIYNFIKLAKAKALMTITMNHIVKFF